MHCWTRYHSSKIEFVPSFFGRNVGLKKSFRLCLTFTLIFRLCQFRLGSHNNWNFVSKLPRSSLKCQSRGQISREIHRCCCLVIFSPQTSLKMRRVKASIYLPCSKHCTLLAFLNFHECPNLILTKIQVLCLRLKCYLSLISNQLVLLIELQTYGIFLIIF